MGSTVSTPFPEEPTSEVPLDPAPIVSAVCQLRFPRVAGLTAQDSLASFQRALRSEYPVMRETHHTIVQIGDDGAPFVSAQPLFRFEDIPSEWVVSLGQESVALQTTEYTSRDDFIDRLSRVLHALDDLQEPSPLAIYDRLGIRYINRLQGPDSDPERLRILTHSAVHEALTPSEQRVGGPQLVASTTHQQYQFGEFQVVARWASLPPMHLLDPTAGVEPVNERSWVFDVDVVVEERREFDVAATVTLARDGAGVAYDFFRWVMTEKFIQERRVGQ